MSVFPRRRWGGAFASHVAHFGWQLGPAGNPAARSQLAAWAVEHSYRQSHSDIMRPTWVAPMGGRIAGSKLRAASPWALAVRAVGLAAGLEPFIEAAPVEALLAGAAAERAGRSWGAGGSDMAAAAMAAGKQQGTRRWRRCTSGKCCAARQLLSATHSAGGELTRRACTHNLYGMRACPRPSTHLKRGSWPLVGWMML